MLEGLALEMEGGIGGEDKYVQYPIKLERWLMEGSYDRVWAATKKEGVPSQEFAVFSEVFILCPSSPPYPLIRLSVTLTTGGGKKIRSS